MDKDHQGKALTWREGCQDANKSVIVHRHQAKSWPAAINLGPNPTFGERRRKLEAHLIGFEGDLYDEPLQVEFVSRIRDTVEFPDVAALKTQLQLDVQQALAVVTRSSNR